MGHDSGNDSGSFNVKFSVNVSVVALQYITVVALWWEVTNGIFTGHLLPPNPLHSLQTNISQPPGVQKKSVCCLEEKLLFNSFPSATNFLQSCVRPNLNKTPTISSTNFLPGKPAAWKVGKGAEEGGVREAKHIKWSKTNSRGICY